CDDLAGVHGLELMLILQHLQQVHCRRDWATEHVLAGSGRRHIVIIRQRDRKRAQLARDITEIRYAPSGTDHECTVKSERRDAIGQLEFPIREMTLDDLVSVSN